LSAALQGTLTAEQKESLLQQGQVRAAFGQGVQQGRRQAMVANRAAGQARATRWGASIEGRRGQRTDGARNVRNRGNRERQPVIDRMVDSLTDEQKASLETLREANRERVQELREAQREGDMDRTEVRKKMDELQTSMREEAHGLLTDEQKARIEELQERRTPRTRTQARRIRGATEGSIQSRVRGRQGQAGVRAGIQDGRPGPDARGMNQDGPRAMADALGLNEDQVETIRIHAALTAGGQARATGRRAARGANRTLRSR
ncbi:MAG: hypothetical protein HKN29_16880, partial [Rhodothermales bacterium]|nr:hypothetical protein [Rhodothermales bacterium]